MCLVVEVTNSQTAEGWDSLIPFNGLYVVANKSTVNERVEIIGSFHCQLDNLGSFESGEMTQQLEAHPVLEGTSSSQPPCGAA